MHTKRIGMNFKISNNLILVIITVIIFLFFVLMDERFVSYSNIIPMLRNLVVFGILALALTPLMISRTVDISYGSNLSLTVVIIATLYNIGLNQWIAILIGIGISTIIGFINGTIIESLNVNPLMFTIGMMAILQSITLVISTRAVGMLTDELYWFGTVKLLQIPIVCWILLLLIFIYWIMLKFTRIGKRIYAIGGSPRISRLRGINVKKIRITLHTFLGLSVGLASVILIASSGVGHPYHGLNLTLPIISGVVLGGVSFMSVGKGSVLGTMLGILIIGLIFNGLSVLNVQSFYIQTIQGVILISVVASYEIRDRNKKKYLG